MCMLVCMFTQTWRVLCSNSLVDRVLAVVAHVQAVFLFVHLSSGVGFDMVVMKGFRVA